MTAIHLYYYYYYYYNIVLKVETVKWMAKRKTNVLLAPPTVELPAYDICQCNIHEAS